MFIHTHVLQISPKNTQPLSPALPHALGLSPFDLGKPLIPPVVEVVITVLLNGPTYEWCHFMLYSIFLLWHGAFFICCNVFLHWCGVWLSVSNNSPAFTRNSTRQINQLSGQRCENIQQMLLFCKSIILLYLIIVADNQSPH